jgi:hypothetical protein
VIKDGITSYYGTGTKTGLKDVFRGSLSGSSEHVLLLPAAFLEGGADPKAFIDLFIRLV